MTDSTAANENLGLCSTCIHFANCTTRQSFKGKILQCEEFDDYLPKQILTGEKKEEEKTPVQYSPLKGLCMNCDFASSCKLFKPDIGVWFCNEYQ